MARRLQPKDCYALMNSLVEEAIGANVQPQTEIPNITEDTQEVPVEETEVVLPMEEDPSNAIPTEIQNGTPQPIEQPIEQPQVEPTEPQVVEQPVEQPQEEPQPIEQPIEQPQEEPTNWKICRKCRVPVRCAPNTLLMI